MKGKRFLTWILTCVFVCALSFGATACEISGDSLPSDLSDRVPSEGLDYVLNADETEYAVNGIGDCTDSDVVIPSTYNGLPVTSISWSAFFDCGNLTSVVISDSVTSIAGSAFHACSNLTSVVIGDGVTSIGNYAFWACTHLDKIYFKNTKTWYCTESSLSASNKTDGKKISVKSASKNAKYFTSTYGNYYWYKL